MVKFKFLKCTILFILFFGLSLNAQKINWDNTPLNPTTIYYSKNHFNLNGPVKEIRETSFGGKLFNLDFNKDGYLTKKLTSSAGGSFKIVTYYTYLTTGVLSSTKQVYLDTKGNPSGKSLDYNYAYNQKGLIASKTQVSKGEKTIYNYDSNNNLISISYINSNGNPVKINEYSYNNYGQIILEKEHNNYNKRVYSYKFKYHKKDKNTLKIELYIYNNDTLAKREYPYAIGSLKRQKSEGVYDNPETYLFDNKGHKTFKKNYIKVSFDQYNNFRSKYSYVSKQNMISVNINYYNNIKSIIEAPKKTNFSCLSGNCTNGYGELKETNGTISKGFFINGKLNGYASQTFSNGDNFLGKFKNGKKNGFGNYSWKESNQQYYGHWQNNAINGYGYVVINGETTDAGIYTNGKLTKDLSVDYKNKKLSGGNCLGNCINGYGTIKYNNGNRYTGFFYNGNPYKSGNYSWAESKNSFIGDFSENGKIHDFGMYIDSTFVYVGDITNGQLTGLGLKTDRKTFIETYGEFKNGTLIVDYKDPNAKITTSISVPKKTPGTCLSGNCTDGYGQLKANKSTYAGFFKNGIRTGYGKEAYNDGSGTYQGNFKNNLRDGYGSYSWHKTEQHYIGFWKGGNQHGYGYLKKGRNVTQAGYYENGKLTRNMLTQNFIDKKPIGNCIGNCNDGFGFYQYSNKDKYVGFFSNGKKSYVGAYSWVSGNAFIGEYTNDSSTGEGSEFYKSNGNSYRGTFLNGKRHGLGLYFDAHEKLISHGIWQSGTLKTKM